MSSPSTSLIVYTPSLASDTTTASPLLMQPHDNERASREERLMRAVQEQLTAHTNELNVSTGCFRSPKKLTGFLPKEFNQEHQDCFLAILLPLSKLNDDDNFSHIARLIHLTQFNEITNVHNKVFPFTSEAYQAFMAASQAKHQANKWLTVGLAGTTFLTLLPFLSEIPQVTSWAQASTFNNLQLSVGIVSVAVLANLINFLATGTIQAAQTTAAEHQIGFLDQTKQDYSDLGISLLQLNKKEPLFACLIANKLNIEKIKEVMESCFSPSDTKVSTPFIRHCCAELNGAKMIIVTGKIPRGISQLMRQAHRSNELEEKLLLISHQTGDIGGNHIG